MNPNRVTVMLMRVNSFEECCQGYLTDFDMSLENIEDFIGGTITMRSITDNLVFLFNVEGYGWKNRYFSGVSGESPEFICGNIICCKLVGSEFIDLSRDEALLFIPKLAPVNDLISTLQIISENNIFEGDT